MVPDGLYIPVRAVLLHNSVIAHQHRCVEIYLHVCFHEEADADAELVEALN